MEGEILERKKWKEERKEGRVREREGRIQNKKKEGWNQE